jgi:hypothetical protein
LTVAGLLDDCFELADGDFDGVALDDWAGAVDELDGVPEGEVDGGVDDGGVDEGGVEDGGTEDELDDDGADDELDDDEEEEDDEADVGGVPGPFTAGSGRVAP